MIRDIIKEIEKFNKERDWNQFHTSKNLAMSISIEAGELLECFQWTTENSDISNLKVGAIEDELADIFLYLLMLSNKLDIDLEDISMRKIKKNEVKYPVEKSKGTSQKYTGF